MKLIADSGSTKVSWRAIKNDGSVIEINSEGINPVFQPKEDIQKILRRDLKQILEEKIDQIFFYGAGVVAPEVSMTLAEVFKEVFPGAECVAESDVLAAARALCGHQPGISCIIGTGSNSCFYDGEKIVKNVKAGGFILGDEGSGGVLGRRFISDYIKGVLPEEITAEFDRRYGLDYLGIVQKVYKEPVPSRFLASFSPFILEFKDNSHIRSLICSNFDDFFKRNIVHYDYEKYSVNVVGSIAFYYEDFLREAAAANNMKIGKILKDPIDGLADYHKS